MTTISRSALVGFAAFLVTILTGPASGPVPVRATASLSLADHPVPIEGDGLPMDAILARIDSLQSRYDEAPERERADLALRLGQLYLATGLRKHKRTALDLLEEAVRNGRDPFTAGRLRAATVHRMRYTGKAREWMHDLVDRFGDEDPRPYAMLGRFHFLEGRRRMERHHFEQARAAFVRSVKTDSTFVDAWYGLACSAVALQQPQILDFAARRLASLQPEAFESLFLEALARQRLGDVETASRLFDEALDRAPTDLVRVFEESDGFLDPRDLANVARVNFPRHLGHAALERLGEDPALGEEIDWGTALRDSTLREQAVRVFWSRANSRPTKAFNPEQIDYWCRLVEADVLFGNPEQGRRGWATAMGDALVRWGWPTQTWFDAGGPGGILSDLNARGFVFEPNEDVPTGSPVIAWGYDDARRGMHFTLLFTDATRNANWTYSARSAYNAAALRRQAPIFVPRPDVPSTPFRLSMSRAVFPRGDDQAVLETYIGLRPNLDLVLENAGDPTRGESTDALGVVEWALYDADGERIDVVRQVLDDDLRRDRLHGRVGWPMRGDVLDPYVIPIGARLPAGKYRVAVEVTGPGGVGRDALTLEVEVPPTEPPSILEMSDLQLASAFGAYDPEHGIPLRYVKFGQTVVPAPDLRIPNDAAAMGVYFEVRHLGEDDRGLTHFDVTYEVFRSDREVRNITLLRENFRREDLEQIAPMTMTFLEERTGVSSEGVVVKGTRVDVEDLIPGDYVLVVTVRDRISAREASRVLPFRKRGT